MTLKKSLNSYLAFLFLFLISSTASALDAPALKGRVNDYGNMLSPSTEQQLDTLLGELERTDSTQIVILSIPSLEGDSIENFSIRVAEKWKIGQKNKDNGAILVISKNDRKLRIEVGYGLEGSLTDLVSGKIIRDVMVPYFKRGDFDAGISNGVQAMILAVRGEFKADAGPAQQQHHRSSGSGIIPVLAVLFLINMMGRVRKPLGMISGGILFPMLAATLFNPGFLILLALIPVGALGGLLFSLFGGPVSFASTYGSSRHGSGFWVSGGRSSGFGGGGFGGFGGGGGGFGGGGASGGW